MFFDDFLLQFLRFLKLFLAKNTRDKIDIALEKQIFIFLLFVYGKKKNLGNGDLIFNKKKTFWTKLWGKMNYYRKKKKQFFY